MHYPWWYVPYLTAPMLIAFISVVHVLVSHYAVGGGLFLAVEVGHAYRTRDRDYLDYLHRHARFFVLLTVVFGAITGVGIWWTIGLASPLATETADPHLRLRLGHRVGVLRGRSSSRPSSFYYYWDRLPEKHARRHRLDLRPGGLDQPGAHYRHHGLHARSGRLGHRPGEHDFWIAFFNPQFLPQTVARTGGALLLSSLYVYLHASLTLRRRAGSAT